MPDGHQGGRAVTGPRHAKEDIPDDNSVCVVTGARRLSPARGGAHWWQRIFSIVRSSYASCCLRISKSEIDRLSREDALKAVRYLATAVGNAHTRQMDGAPRKTWWPASADDASSRLQAPAWLWSSVVALAAHHEAAYLEHCREYALDAAPRT